MPSDQVMKFSIFNLRSTLTVSLFFLACSGKTALAATVGIDSGFPFVKIVRSIKTVPFIHYQGLGSWATLILVSASSNPILSSVLPTQYL